MVLGMSLATFTLVHVFISIVGLASGLIVVERFVRNRALGLSNTIFLVSTIATSATGFLFPSEAFTPAHVVGVVSLLILAAALFALHVGNLIGPWRWVYGVAAVMALYLNVFVAVVQAFQKVGRLRVLAPTQSEPPFAFAQGAVLIFFVLVGILVIRRFRPPTA